VIPSVSSTPGVIKNKVVLLHSTTTYTKYSHFKGIPKYFWSNEWNSGSKKLCPEGQALFPFLCLSEQYISAEVKEKMWFQRRSPPKNSEIVMTFWLVGPIAHLMGDDGCVWSTGGKMNSKETCKTSEYTRQNFTSSNTNLIRALLVLNLDMIRRYATTWLWGNNLNYVCRCWNCYNF